MAFTTHIPGIVHNVSGEEVAAFTLIEVEATAAFHALMADGLAAIDAVRLVDCRFDVTQEFSDWLVR